MTREIKFRAWNGFMGTPFNIQKDDPDGFPLSEKIPLMQFTGLKDKNGVEIYEGDILDHGHKGVTWLVFWSNKTASFRIRKIVDNELWPESETLDLNISETHTDIISGNIYQNPELLNPAITK